MDPPFDVVRFHREQELMIQLNKAEPDGRLVRPKAEADGWKENVID